MIPQAKEIYLIRVELGYSKDIRPCVVIETLGKDRVKVAPISSALDLYKATIDFLIDSNHPNFKDTGLKRASYISG